MHSTQICLLTTVDKIHMVTTVTRSTLLTPDRLVKIAYNAAKNKTVKAPVVWRLSLQSLTLAQKNDLSP